MRSITPVLTAILLVLRPVYALSTLPPMKCPSGTPLGRFDIVVTPPAGGEKRPLQAMNRLLEGYRISYQPREIDSVEKKKVRISLLLVPTSGSKIVVTDPKPANEPIDWTVPSETQIVGLVWGPVGLDKAKVTSLVKKNDELIAQLADYAEKSEETQALIAQITQEQAAGTTQDVDAAVSGFASKYSANKIDPTQPMNTQMLQLIQGVNPALTEYDPLAPDPQQRAAQTAGLLAAVSGMFLGGGVGLAAEGGAVLVNMHSLLFPNTEFRSALAQNGADLKTPDSKDSDSKDMVSKDMMGLCGNKKPSASRTELAFLWATRLPDSAAPEIKLSGAQHAAIGGNFNISLAIKGLKDPKFAARADGWKLISADGKTSVPITVKMAANAKSVDLDLDSDKLKPGKWNLAANWDWDPVSISGELELHAFSKFDKAHLEPQSQDKLVALSGEQRLELIGDDFEFVQKVSYKKSGDPFAQPVTAPFRLPDGAGKGPEPHLETQIDAGSLKPGDYTFLIAQSDDKPHEVPFKVLPPAPEISNLPLNANTGLASQTFMLRGSGLDRIEQITADSIDITLGDTTDPAKRNVTIKLPADAAAGKSMTLNMKVKDVAEPVVLTDAITVAGPRPVISGVRKSIPGDLGIALLPDEIPAGSFASFAMNVDHASAISGVSLACAGAPAGTPPLKIKNGEAGDNGRLHQESAQALFLSFNPEKAGQPGCAIMATLSDAVTGDSEPRRLGMIVGLPKIESFQLTSEKSGDSSYVGILKGRDLETIEKAGWTEQSGTPVDAIPTPMAGEPNKQTLRIVVPWPAPGPHAPLYVWLRGETTGRLTSATY